MDCPHVVVLAIDGLRASALGAYGNTWRPTPAFDSFASEASLVEWAYADRPTPSDFYRDLLAPSHAWSSTTIVTDDPAIAESPGVAAFDGATVVDPPAVTHPASDLGATWLASTFGRFADAVMDAEQGVPTLTWLHCRGLGGPWDAPSALIEELLDEDDPEIEASVAPAAGAINRQQDPDSVFGAACRYAAQMAVLDACFESWLALVDDDARGEPTTVVVLGLRGFALGEHDHLGIQEAAPYGESRHVPLLIRISEGRVGARWGDGLLGLSSTPSLIGQLAGAAALSVESLIAEHSTQQLVMPGAAGAAVGALDWRLVHKQAEDRNELYAKPDDRWEANDVAALRPEVVAELSSLVTDERC